MEKYKDVFNYFLSSFNHIVNNIYKKDIPGIAVNE